jgi:hypothetical protein
MHFNWIWLFRTIEISGYSKWGQTLKKSNCSVVLDEGAHF